nr:MAG TPA: hypothetical protein [Caudoviricetes sp.]
MKNKNKATRMSGFYNALRCIRIVQDAFLFIWR